MATLLLGTTPNWPLTITPPQQGNPSNHGYGFEPIARWCRPQWDTYNSSAYTIGLLAFHTCGHVNGNNGIQKVTFVANNGTPLDVTSPTLNPTNGYWEYWCNISTLLEDGIVEIRAIIYPTDGIPFVLQGDYRIKVGNNSSVPATDKSLLLWSNGLGTFTKTPVYVDSVGGNDTTGTGSSGNPYATIRKAIDTGYVGNCENGLIYLKGGSYQMPADGGTSQNVSRWLTIRPAPGVNRSSVYITSANGTGATRMKLIRFQDLTVDRTTGNPPILGLSTTNKVYVWLDGVEMFGTGRDDPNGSELRGNASVGISYFTKSASNRGILRNWRIASSGSGAMMMGVDIYSVSGDLCNIPFARDCKWRDQRSVGKVHGDWVQTSSLSQSNCIWVDNIAWDVAVQLLFQTDTLMNIRHAYVNNTGFKLASDGKGSYIGRNDGCIYWHNTWGNQILKFAMDEENTSTYAPNYGVEKSRSTSFYGNIMKIAPGTEVTITTETFEQKVPEIKWAYNHYWGGGNWYPGSGATTGTVTYRKSLSGDYYPLGPVGVVSSRVPPLIPWDQSQRTRNALSYVGALDSDGILGADALIPALSIEGGVFESSIIVSIESTTGSTVYYTLNGADPTVSSSVYISPLTISSNVTLKSFATKGGLNNSEIKTANYVIDNSGKPSSPSGITVQAL